MQQLQSNNEITNNTEPHLQIIYDINEQIPGVSERLVDEITYPILKIQSNAYVGANNDPDICKKYYEECLDLFHESLSNRSKTAMFEQHGRIEKVTPVKITILDNLALVEAHAIDVNNSSEDMPINYILLRNSDTDEFQFYKTSSIGHITSEYLYTLAISIPSNTYSVQCDADMAIAE
jgi:hypothetical protein